jgi:hypothetical protein
MSTPEPPRSPPPSLSELAARRAAAPPSPSSPPPASEPPASDEIGTWRPVSAKLPDSGFGAGASSAPVSSGKWGRQSQATKDLRKKVANISGSRLVEAVREMIGQADDALFKFAEQASGTPNQEFLTAFKILRQHRAPMERSFHEAIDRAWGVGGEDKPKSALGSLEGLSLVNDEELEESLAENLAVAHADRLMSSEASALTRRLAIIDAIPEGSPPPANPLAASVISEAFKSAMKEVADLPVTAKMIVFKLFDRHVLALLPEVLVEVNLAFVDAGVLPDLKPAVVKSKDDGASHAGSGQGAGGQGGLPLAAHEGGFGGPGWSSPDGVAMPGAMGAQMQGGPAYAGPVVPWSAVQSLLAANRSPVPMIMGPDGEAIPAPSVPMGDLINAIEHLNQSVSRLDNIEPMALKKVLSELISSRDNKPTQEPEVLGDHEDAIDMIDLLFNFILKDSELPNQIQTLLVRLQMPFLRIAVLEPELFASSDHPSRMLLNTLSEAGKTWNEASDRSGEFKKLIEETVTKVVDEFEKGSPLCRELNTDFTTKWEAIRARASVSEKRATEATAGKEKLELARSASAKAIVNHLAGLVLPDRLRMAIHRAWAHYMTLVALREGEESRSFKRATGLLVTVASLSKMTPGDRSNATRKNEMELLLTDWGTGLETAGLQPHEIQSWKAVLAEFCNERLGYEVAPVSTKPWAGVSNLAHEDIEATVTRSALPNEAVSEAAMEVVNALTNGTWVEWRNPNLRAKLAWIGGFTGKLMFVDHRGNKAVETHKQVLARELEQKIAVVLSDAPLVDQAFGAIEKKLSSSDQKL